MLRIETSVDAIARIGRALADPTRARILVRLHDAPGYPAAIADELGLTRQNVSNHLACLRDCGIVVAEPEGRQVRYELASAALGHAIDDLLSVALAVDPHEHADARRPLSRRARAGGR